MDQQKNHESNTIRELLKTAPEERQLRHKLAVLRTYTELCSRNNAKLGAKVDRLKHKNKKLGAKVERLLAVITDLERQLTEASSSEKPSDKKRRAREVAEHLEQLVGKNNE